MRTLVLDGPGLAEPDPALVTPAADHWMENLFYLSDRQLVRNLLTKPIATTYLGIVTTRDMAQCLGWPEREIGFEDVIRLAVESRGWREYSCAKPEWGDDVLLAFTYPRSV